MGFPEYRRGKGEEPKPNPQGITLRGCGVMDPGPTPARRPEVPWNGPPERVIGSAAGDLKYSETRCFYSLNPQLLGFLLGDGYATYNKARKSYDIGFEQNVIKNKAVLIKYATLMAAENPRVQVSRKRRNKVRIYVHGRKIYQLFRDVKKTRLNSFVN